MKTLKQFINELGGGGRGVKVSDPQQVTLRVILKGNRTIKSVTNSLKDVFKNAMLQSIQSIINDEEPKIRVKMKISKKRKKELQKELDDLK